MPNKAFIPFSSRNFMVLSSRSVQAASSTSTLFEVDGAEDEGRGKMQSLKTCSATGLDDDTMSNDRVRIKYAYFTSVEIPEIRNISLGIHENCRMAAGSPFSL
jgi:hypothetical protein